MNKDEVNKEQTVGLEPLTDVLHTESPVKSRLKAYTVAASIALGSILGILGYGVGHYTRHDTNQSSSQQVVRNQITEAKQEQNPVVHQTQKEDPYFFAGVRWEPKALEYSNNDRVWLRYDKSSARLKKKNMRHAYLWEQGELFCAGLEGKLTGQMQEVYDNFWGEWINGGISWKGKEFLYYPDADFLWKDNSYVIITQGDAISAVAKKIKKGWNEIGDLGDDVSRLVYGRNVNELPSSLQKYSEIYLQEEGGKIQPVGRGIMLGSYDVYTSYYLGASRGVSEVQRSP